MGAPNAEATTKKPPRFRPYQHNVTIPVEGIEVREPSCTNSQPANCSEFYVVRIFGSENATLVSGPDVLKVCSSKPQWRFRLDVEDKSIEYNQSKYAGFPSVTQTLVVQEFRGVVFGEKNAIQGCPTSYGLFPFSKTPPPAHRSILGSYGVLNATVYRSGGIVVNQGQITFPLGEKLVVSYGNFRVIGDSTYFVQGGFEIANLGPWPVGALRPGEGSSQGQG
jgi:hypothetical protein